MTNPTACRAAFEKWCNTTNFTKCIEWNGTNYVHPEVDSAWDIWQAAWNTRPTEGEAVAVGYFDMDEVRAALIGTNGDIDPTLCGHVTVSASPNQYEDTPLYTRPRATSDEVEGLKQFVALMFKATDWPDGGDLDGFEFQEIAVKCGLLEEVTQEQPCGEVCQCYDMGADFPAQCFRKTPLYYSCAALAKRGEG